MLFLSCKCHSMPSLCLVLSVNNCLKYCCDFASFGSFSVWSCQSIKPHRCNKSQVRVVNLSNKVSFNFVTGAFSVSVPHVFSSQGYESNTQLLPPYITAYSQFVESTESMDKINVPVTSLIKSKIPVAFVIHCFVSLSLITGPRFHH